MAAMLRILFPVSAALAACLPWLQETAVQRPVPGPGKASPTSAKAAQGPMPEAVSAAENLLPAPGPLADSPEEARGRRTLSTAFVRLGPGEHLTVELRDGRVLALRDVAMRARDYCGVQVSRGAAGKRFCGSYADVRAARAVSGPAS
jgi:hypothetical protein